jgi:hypothetical protein
LRLAKHPPTRREALDSLFRIYRSSNDLKKLLDIARQIHNNAPNDLAAKITFARLVLLLEPNTAEGRQLAEEAYEQAPSDTACAVTYAFSLYEQGRTTEGIEVLKKLSWTQLHDPHAAVYVAVLLLDDNQADAAREYIEVTEAGHIDIEEKRLLDDARTKVGTNAPSPSPSARPTPTPTATAKPTVTPTPRATAEQSPN